MTCTKNKKKAILTEVCVYKEKGLYKCMLNCQCAVVSADCHSTSIKTNSFTASFTQMFTGTTTMGDGRVGNVWGRGIDVGLYRLVLRFPHTG